MSHHPEVKWAEREDKVYLTVLLPDAKDANVKLDPEGVFDFSAKAGPENQLYELKLELHDKVNVEESKINIGLRSIFCIVEKAEPRWWSKLLRVGGKPPHYVKVDWDKWVDEDEEDPSATGPGDMDMGGMGGMGGMDFSNFGGMGGLEGLGGMGGMAGPGGMEEFEDSDDEGEEDTSGEKKEEAPAPAPATEEETKTTEEQTSVKSDK